MSVLNKIVAGVVALGVMAPAMAFAQTSTTTTNAQAVLAQIQALQAQIAALQAQYKLLLEQQNTAYQSLYQTLKEGSAGDQVAILQALLALDPSIYPEGRVTGFFGRLTAEAVKRYQRKHGIDALGLVGPKTLKKLNEEFRGFDNDENDDDDDREHGKGRDKVTICHKGQTIVIGAPAAFAHIKHGDTRGACGGGTGTTTPPTNDTTPPVLFNISVSGLGPTTATINWTTNEGASTQVMYGLTSTYTSSTTLNTTLMTSHIVGLTGLAPSTMYHYAIQSKDASGNTSTSGDLTFTTPAVPDTTAPIISNINISGLASTTGTVGWTTNENATGKVTYGTSSTLAGASTQDSVLMTLGHSFVLGGLTASTTYYYMLESKDAANNTATTSIASFTTVN